MISRERWGGKVYPEVVIAEDFPERRLVMMRRNTHKTAITIDSFIHSWSHWHYDHITWYTVDAPSPRRFDRPPTRSPDGHIPTPSLARPLAPDVTRSIAISQLTPRASSLALRGRPRARSYRPHAIAAAVLHACSLNQSLIILWDVWCSILDKTTSGCWSSI